MMCYTEPISHAGRASAKGGNTNKKCIAVKIIAVLVGTGGLLAIYAWFFDNPTLKSVFPDFVTMKFLTAFTFLLSGFALYALAVYIESGGTYSEMTLAITSSVILSLMAALLIGVMFQTSTGLENLVTREPVDASWTKPSGIPAVPTMLSFALFAVAGLAALVRRRERLRRMLVAVGIFHIAVGGVALVGYALSLPSLYYQFSPATVDLSTAALFVLFGFGLCIIRTCEQRLP